MKVLKSVHTGAYMWGMSLDYAKTHRQDYIIVDLPDPEDTEAPQAPKPKAKRKTKARKKAIEDDDSLSLEPDDAVLDLLDGVDGTDF